MSTPSVEKLTPAQKTVGGLHNLVSFALMIFLVIVLARDGEWWLIAAVLGMRWCSDMWVTIRLSALDVKTKEGEKNE